MRYRDFKLVENRVILKESGTTNIRVGSNTYQVGNDLIKDGNKYAVFSGDSARRYAEENGLVVPPREVLQQVYSQGRQLEMPVRPNNPTNTDQDGGHTQEIFEANNLSGFPSGLVYGHKKEIAAGDGTVLFGGIVGGRQLQAGTRAQHGGNYLDYSQGMRECKLVEGSDATPAAAASSGEVYVIGDSHAKAMGGSNNIAANGARLNAIASQAEQVSEGATVYMTGGHNDVAAGTSPEQIANQVKTIIDSLKEKNCTVNYVLFPEGSGTANQENMAPTREAIKGVTDIFHDLDGSEMQRDGIHAVLSAYRGIVGGSGNGGTVTRSDSNDPSGTDGLEAGPPYPSEQMDAVRAMQRKLEELGYPVGSTGIDGKYGPRTVRAVRAFKQDNNIDGDGTTMSAANIEKLNTAEKVENPTPTGNPAGPDLGDIGDLASLENIGQAQEVVNEFLGREISGEEMNMLIRATAAEASRNSQERAGVAAVILNRARSSQYPDGIRAVLTQRNQFQAVTGTRYDPGPSTNFTNMSDSTGAEVIGAIIRYLPNMDKSWLNFTSNVAGAYGAGTNINFMYAMRDAPGSQVIGQTVFGTA